MPHRHVTVCWEDEARDELGALWLAVDDRGGLSGAVNEIDQLLKVSPSTKGKAFGLSMLDEEGITLILQRAHGLPEDLRRIRCGPIEAFFTAHELDRQAKVWHVRLRMS